MSETFDGKTVTKIVRDSAMVTIGSL